MDHWAEVEQRKQQAIIETNKKFIRCAKKMAQIAYGKVTVTPDPVNPLKSTIGVYRTGWYDLEFRPMIKEVRRRKHFENYYDRYQYRSYCVVRYRGATNTFCISSDSTVKITSRSPKIVLALLKTIEEKLDRDIKQEDDEANERITRDKLVNDARNRIKGLTYREGEYRIGEEVLSDNRYKGVSLTEEGLITIRDISLSIDDFNKLTLTLGWRKEN